MERFLPKERKLLSEWGLFRPCLVPTLHSSVVCIEETAKEQRGLSDREGVLGKGSVKICEYL